MNRQDSPPRSDAPSPAGLRSLLSMSGFDLFAYAVVSITWGGSWYVATYQLGVVPVENSVAYRFLLGALFLLPWMLARRGGANRLSARDHGWIALQGALLFSSCYWCFYLSLEVLTSGLVAVLFCMIVIANAYNQALFFKHPLEPRVLVAAIVGIAGVGLIFAPELWAVNANFDTLKGVGWMTLAVCLASLGNMVALRNNRAGIPAATATTYSMGYGGVLLLLACLLKNGAPAFEWSVPYILSLLYLSLIGSALIFALYLGLIARVGAAKGAYVTVLTPLVALTISSLFEDFEWRLEAGGGVLLILFGNLLILTRSGGNAK